MHAAGPFEKNQIAGTQHIFKRENHFETIFKMSGNTARLRTFQGFDARPGPLPISQRQVRAGRCDLFAEFRVESLFPGAGRAIADQFVFRAPFVEPIWSVGYSQRCAPTSVIPGRLYLACTAQVYPRVNSWNSCCEVVEEMMKGLVIETAAVAA